MIKKLNIILFIVSLIYLQGCSRDEIVNPTPDASTLTGAYLLSEGSFSAGSSRLSFYNSSSNVFTENIFSPGTPGLFSSGLKLYGNDLYMLEQGNFGSAGKIYKLDTNGTVILSQNAGTNPYSIAVTENKIYITNGPANNVSVIDRSTLITLTTISVGLYPQEILYHNGKIFVCNTSVFGGATDSTVSVIDVNSDQVIATIKVLQTPSSLAVSNDGNLYIGCPGSNSTGKIFTVNPDNYGILDTFTIGNGNAIGFEKDISVDPNSDYIYFISFYNNIVRFNTSTETSSMFIPNPNTASYYFYGYNYDPVNKKHFVTDAKNFQVSGNLYVYDVNGNLQSTNQTGIAPRRIVIKN